MTLSKSLFVYAQSLDNSGEVEVWQMSDLKNLKRVHNDIKTLSKLTSAIDKIEQEGRYWKLGSEKVSFRVAFNGDCYVKIKPTVLDSAGRVSPILVVSNVYSNNRLVLADCVRNIKFITTRDCGEVEKIIAKKLFDILSLSRVIIFIRYLFLPRSAS